MPAKQIGDLVRRPHQGQQFPMAASQAVQKTAPDQRNGTSNYLLQRGGHPPKTVSLAFVGMLCLSAIGWDGSEIG